MTTQNIIEQKILDALTPSYLDVINESHMHNVPPGSESHFKVVVVSEAFDGQRLVQRHQQINALLADELAGGVHALTMQTLTEAEWVKKNGYVPDSPNCHGGSKADR
ncbi:MAG: BolA/IbaG family iron-sulfur metabolism protein [Rhodospirillaceae bacterium]|jgi:BolA protein